MKRLDLKTFFSFFAVFALIMDCGPVEVIRDIFSGVSSSDVPALFVETDGDDSNDCLSRETACLTVAHALEISSANGTIFIGSGEFPISELFPRHAITFIGIGPDSTGLYNVGGLPGFRIDISDPVAIRNLSIRQVSSQWGAVAVDAREASNVELSSCRIHAIAWALRLSSRATVTVSDCTFEDVSQAVINGGYLRMTDTVIRFNANTFHAVEAPAVLENRGIAELTDTLFQGNGHTDESTAYPSVSIANWGHLSITSSTFSENLGHTIALHAGDAELSHVQIYGNDTIGITHYNGNLTVHQSVIRDNSGAGIAMENFESEHNTGTVAVIETAIVRNQDAGGRVWAGNLTIQNSTISGTRAGGELLGDGIWNNTGVISLLDSTVAFNSGAGIRLSTSTGGSLDSQRSVIALNGREECTLVGAAAMTSDSPGHFTCDDSWTAATLGLGPLADEAGTLIHPLLPASPLIDAVAAPASCPPNDQRGVGRPAGSSCDFGAYEVAGASEALIAATPGSGTPDIIPLITVTPSGPSGLFLIFTKNAFCRKGPSSQYRDVGSFNQGDTAQVDGKNDGDPRWWYVLMANGKDHCWVSASTVQPNDQAESLPMQQVDLALPETPSDFSIANRVCSPNGFSITLAWGSSNGAEGFTLYRNGEELTSFENGKNGYLDNPPMNTGLHYELEAYNGAGYSQRLVAEDVGCP